MTLEYILNEPSIMENDGKLRKREYTLLLKDNMSNISNDGCLSSLHTLMLTVMDIMMPILK